MKWKKIEKNLKYHEHWAYSNRGDDFCWQWHCQMRYAHSIASNTKNTWRHWNYIKLTLILVQKEMITDNFNKIQNFPLYSINKIMLDEIMFILKMCVTANMQTIYWYRKWKYSSHKMHKIIVIKWWFDIECALSANFVSMLITNRWIFFFLKYWLLIDSYSLFVC